MRSSSDWEKLQNLSPVAAQSLAEAVAEALAQEVIQVIEG